MTEQKVPLTGGAHSAMPRDEVWDLHLFIAGNASFSQTAITNLTLFCECRLAGRHKLTVTDVSEDPDAARADQICAVPALLRRRPVPVRMILGDFSNFDALARSLGIAPDAAAAAPPDARDSVHLNMGALIGAADTASATVLVTDDEDCVRSLAADLLGLHGYNVLTACNGEQALSVLQEHSGKVDLVLTDIVMPVMDGPELIARLRTLYPDVKVLFMSGYADRSMSDQLAQFPSAQLVAKPFTLDMLVHKVREVLAVPQS